jgi:hypothetical protein
LLQDFQGLRLETGQRRTLRHARSTDVEVLRELFQVANRRFRRDQPTQSPTGHTEVLGKTIQHERVVIHFQHAGGVGSVGEAVINFVHHQMTVPCLERGGQCCELVAMQQCAGRVRWRRDQCAHAVLVPMSRDQIRRQLITHLRTNGHQLCSAFHQPQKMPVAGVTRIGQQPVLARIDQQARRQQ